MIDMNNYITAGGGELFFYAKFMRKSTIFFAGNP